MLKYVKFRKIAITHLNGWTRLPTIWRSNLSTARVFVVLAILEPSCGVGSGTWNLEAFCFGKGVDVLRWFIPLSNWFPLSWFCLECFAWSFFNRSIFAAFLLTLLIEDDWGTLARAVASSELPTAAPKLTKRKFTYNWNISFYDSLESILILIKFLPSKLFDPFIVGNVGIRLAWSILHAVGDIFAHEVDKGLPVISTDKLGWTPPPGFDKGETIPGNAFIFWKFALLHDNRLCYSS